ncbi:MerR family transcriptional regulator [Qipengyuania spongiae]|uniref:MerR family transcriptional regulator n=1 Tax=Qipengyuania spongiae TaxID=2909673 RepID=A0ABY5SY90_9SPHN|nr:MerR family transcriptional regulator [Qipengyuania spongiae]UVI38103.1 MerR family transcriptional regulator [Qipengyuania spongiae]
MTGFNDGKDDSALRTIGEVGNALGIKTHVLRYWEQQFPMLRPLKRSGGRRYYRPEDVELVRTIDRLVNAEGYTLKGAKGVLKSEETSRASVKEDTDRKAAAPQPAAGSQPNPVDAQLLMRLKSIRDDLQQAIAS